MKGSPRKSVYMAHVSVNLSPLLEPLVALCGSPKMKESSRAKFEQCLRIAVTKSGANSAGKFVRKFPAWPRHQKRPQRKNPSH